MKALGGLAVLVVSLCGCATAPPSEATADLYQIDTVRVNAIEQAATRLGVRVYWINAPRKAGKPIDG